MINNLAMAMQMETDGEQYYLLQAEKHKGSSMQRAFLLLAKAENKHYQLLKQKYFVEGSATFEGQPTDESSNLFSGKADFQRDAERLPGQLEIYVFALDMEQKSIDLYQKMLEQETDKQTRRLLKYLLVQEQAHYAFFDELAVLLRKPRDWVEDAEFGPREEY